MKNKITNNTVACVSDLHYGVHQNSPIWHDIAINHAKWFKTELCARGINDIIIPGDIFHNRSEISVNTLHVVNEIFRIWQSFNIIITPGNHDAFYKDRADINSLGLLNGWDNITVFNEPTVINAFGKQLGFSPWASDMNPLKGCDIIFGHFAINNFKVTPTKLCEEGVNSNVILDYGKLIISGHFHFTEARKYDNGIILYLGCPYEMYWSDYGNKKGFYILDLISHDFEFVENNESPKHKKLRFSELVDNGGIPTYWSKDVPGNIVSFIVDKKVDPDKLTLITNKIQSLKPLNYKIDYDELNTKSPVDNINTELTGIDIPSCIREFVEQLEINHKNEITEYTIDLYNKISK